MTTQKCMKVGCSAESEGIIKLYVPAEGWAIGAHEPVSVFTGIHVCEECFKKSDAQLVMNKQLRGVIDTVTKHKSKPDFKRAFINLVKIGTNEFITWQLHARRHLNGTN